VPVVEKQGADPFARGLAEPGGPRRFLQELDDRIAERPDVSWVCDQQSAAPVLDLLEMTPHGAGDDGTGLPHASVTPRPNPSCKLFLTTTAARRWIAFTIAASSSGEVSGKQAT
jgi:hypothetical protein